MLTFADAVERLVDYVGGSGSDQLLRDCKQAAIEALDDLAGEHPWTYLYTQGRVVTQASFTDGTITYQAASGTVPYLVTLTGGVWPAWAGQGSLRIANINYDVAARVSDTQIALGPVPAPLWDDITEPTPYGLFQDAYDLPGDFMAQDLSFIPNNFAGLTYVHPRDWLLDTSSWGVQGTPWRYTIMAPPDDPSRLQLRLAPYPVAMQPIDFLYKRRPGRLSVYLEQAGNVTLQAGSATVTGLGTSWTPAMAPGTVLRVGFGPKPPTSPAGQGPAAFESRALAVAAPNALAVADAAPFAVTAGLYTLSSRVDVDPLVMMEAYLRNCERHICINRVLKDKPSARVQYAEALELAKCADCRSAAPRVASPPGLYGRRLRDYPIDLRREL